MCLGMFSGEWAEHVIERGGGGGGGEGGRMDLHRKTRDEELSNSVCGERERDFHDFVV